MNENHRVFITGIGIISPLGLDVESTWSGIVSGHSGIDFITAFDTEGFDTSFAGEVKGKVTKTEREGRVVTIGGTKVKISGSRTEVTIGGKEADREEIKVGMSCTAMVAKRKGKDEAKTVKC